MTPEFRGFLELTIQASEACLKDDLDSYIDAFQGMYDQLQAYSKKYKNSDGLDRQAEAELRAMSNVGGETSTIGLAAFGTKALDKTLRVVDKDIPPEIEKLLSLMIESENKLKKSEA